MLRCTRAISGPDGHLFKPECLTVTTAGLFGSECMWRASARSRSFKSGMLLTWSPDLLGRRSSDAAKTGSCRPSWCSARDPAPRAGRMAPLSKLLTCAHMTALRAPLACASI